MTINQNQTEPANPHGAGRIGFFGATDLSYEAIENAPADARLPAWAAQPCMCVN